MTVLGKQIPAAAGILVAALAARIVSMAFLPITDPTEGRYAQIAQEMTLTSDWVTPRIWMNETHIPFMGKPPLFFWAAAGALRLLGENEFAVRLPSMIAALALLWLLFVVMERYGERSGLLSVLVTASCGFFFAVSGVVAIDMLLTTCVAGSLLAYFAFTCEPDPVVRRRWSLFVFLLLALGFLTKGPVAVVLFGLPVLTWTVRWRQWSALRDHSWAAGTVLVLALVLPWFFLCESRNPGSLKYFFLNENLLRFVTHDYGDAYGNGHLYPRGSALLMFLAVTAPWSAFAIWHVVRTHSAMRTLSLGRKQESFLFLGFAVGTLFWCFARQLLFTYLLPLLPLFAAWLAWTLQRQPALKRSATAAASLLLAVMGALALAGPLTLQNTASARQIVRAAQHHAAAHAFKGPLIFAHKTPYSALFYARGWVLPHPKEPLSVSIQRCRGMSDNALVITQGARNADLQNVLWEGSQKVAACGTWTLTRVSLRAPTSRKLDSLERLLDEGE